MNKSVQNFVFIVGCARTGSKLHADMLNQNSKINLVDELHFLAPRWVRKDFRQQAKLVGCLNSDKNLEHLVEKMFQCEFSGTFWKKPPIDLAGNPPQTIFDLDKNEVLARIKRTDRNLKDIFQCLITMQSEFRNKNMSGAKFPVDIGCFDILYNWFPEAKFIHLVRDPRAIYTSMVSMDEKYGTMINGVLKRQGRPFQRLAYLISRYKKAAKIHTKYGGYSNYYVSPFEEMIRDPQEGILSISKFLEADYEENMLQPRIRSSSYGSMQAGKHKGFDENAIDRWRNHIPKGAGKLLEVTLSKEMNLFGY